MNTVFRAICVGCVVVLLQACAEEAEGPPPLFNARDLSMQCPTGQVGWDFSTGGNDTDIVEYSVSREITIDSATLGSCNYTADFAADCDGKSECVRTVRKTTSPACPAGGALNLVYRCGSETPRYNVVLPSDASAQTVTLACGEPITILSAIYGSNATARENQANITTAVASACTGKRRCSLDDPYVLNNRQDPWPNVNKDTLVRYYCGTEAQVRETTVPAGQRIDIQCPKVLVQPPDVKETLRVVSVACAADTAAETTFCNQLDTTRRGWLADWDKRVRAACEGQRYCKLPMFPWAQGQGSLQMEIIYYCTSPQAPERRRFFHHDTGERNLELFCGSPIHFADITGNGASAEEARSACENKSRCILPPVSAPDAGRMNNPTTYTASYSYYCGENGFDVRNKTFVQNSLFAGAANGYRLPPNTPGAFHRQIQCEPPNNNLQAGIRVVSATFGGQDGIVRATSACYGRDTCFIQTNNSGDTATYRCGNSNATQTATYKSILPAGLVMSCRPDVKIKSIQCDLIDGASAPPPEYPSRCIDNQDTSRYTSADLTTWCYAGNNGTCDLNFRRLRQGTLPQTVRLTYTCGPDPKEYEYYGPGELKDDTNGQYNVVKLRCAVPDQPYVEKACVPERCASNQRRDSKLACTPDSTKMAATVFSAPLLREWLPGADGGTSQWGGAAVTDLKEDFPYQVFNLTQYRATGGAQLPPSTRTTVWAYDEFVASADAGVAADKQTTFGFRCLLGEASIRDSEYSSITPGYRRVINGGKGGVLPVSCYRQNVDDGRNAWSDAARRVGVPESQFRRNYTRRASWVVSSFDAAGKTTAWQYPGRPNAAPNPIGFFYNSNNGWIDWLGYYAQTADFRFKTGVTFVESNTIELEAQSARLRQALLKVDVAQPTLLPSFDVDFTWSQRGDSPARNPLSPRSLLSANAATPLSRRDLRATIEVARVDATASNEWLPVNATQFPTRGLGEGNAFSQTLRMTAEMTPALRERILSVRGTEALQTANGWMRGFDEDTTTFKVRVCMDFNDLAHALGDTTLDNRFVSAARDGVTYQLGFTRRCADAGLLVIERELFIYPTTAVATAETPANSASSARQGDSAAGSTNDMGNQSACTDMGSSGQNCSGQSRTNMTTGGQFSLSVIQSQTDDQATQEETVKTTRMSSNMTLFGFRVFDLSGGNNAEPQSSGAWQVKIDLTPNLEPIEQAIKRRRNAGGVKTDAKKVKTRPKGKKGAVRQAFGAFERDGLAMALSKEFPFTLGPFPFELEVGFSVGFGFGASVTLAGDRQSTTSMVNPKYPCLKSTAGECVIAYSDTKGFDDALRECRFKGGRLAEVRTADDLTEVTGAVSTLGSSNRFYWLGGQLAYQYADPRCEQTRDARCAGISRTRYSWLTGNVPFATQARLEPALLTPSNFLANHGFGSNLGNLVSRVPNKASVLFNKDTGRLETATVETTAPYVCAFEPAGKYVETSIGVEVKVEFSMGFNAALCTPSAKIGFCLTAGLNLMTAGVNVSATRTRIVVFNNSNIKVSLLGESRVEGTWEVAFMSGAFGAELRALFWNTGWEIASYKGLFALEGELFSPIVSPYWRKF